MSLEELMTSQNETESPQRSNYKMGPKSNPCGCREHFPNELVFLQNIDFEKTFSTLLNSKAMANLLRGHGYREIKDGDYEWTVDESIGIKARRFSSQVNFSLLADNVGGQIRTCMNDRILKFEQGNTLIIESDAVYSGVPGGSCFVNSRQCLQIQQNGQANYLATCDVRVPENSWFKESIKNAFLHHFAQIHRDLSNLLISDIETLALGKDQETTINEIYFDVRAFLYSFFTIIPIVMTAVGIYFFIFGNTFINNDSSAIFDRDKVERIKMQLNDFIKIKTERNLDRVQELIIKN